MKATIRVPQQPTHGFDVNTVDDEEHVRLLDQLEVAIQTAVPAATLMRQLPGRLCVYFEGPSLVERTEWWLRAKGVDVEVKR